MNGQAAGYMLMAQEALEGQLILLADLRQNYLDGCLSQQEVMDILADPAECPIVQLIPLKSTVSMIQDSQYDPAGCLGAKISMFFDAGAARPLITLRSTRRVGPSQKLILSRQGASFTPSELRSILIFMNGDELEHADMDYGSDGLSGKK